MTEETERAKPLDGRIKISYTLFGRDIWNFVMRAYLWAFVFPAMLSGFVIYFAIVKQGFIVYFSVSMLLFTVCAIFLLVLALYKNYKRDKYHMAAKADFVAELDDLGVIIYQNTNDYYTVYTWEDFKKAKETKHQFYLFFGQNTGLIVKKQHFVTGDLEMARNLLTAKFIAFKPKKNR